MRLLSIRGRLAERHRTRDFTSSNQSLTEGCVPSMPFKAYHSLRSSLTASRGFDCRSPIVRGTKKSSC